MDTNHRMDKLQEISRLTVASLKIYDMMQAQTKLNDMLLNLLHAKCNLTDDETRELAALIRAVKDVL